jgi:hypothetical protein
MGHRTDEARAPEKKSDTGPTEHHVLVEKKRKYIFPAAATRKYRDSKANTLPPSADPIDDDNTKTRKKRK